jgi:hypothetical protein
MNRMDTRLNLSHDRDLPDMLPGIRRDPLQQRRKMFDHPQDRIPIKQIRVALQGPCQAILPFRQREHDVKFGSLGIHIEPVALAIAQRNGGFLLRLKDKHGLKQRGMAHIPRWMQFLHEFFKRHIPVLERTKAHSPHTPEQVAKCRVPSKVGPQDKRVHKETDQFFDFHPPPACNRCPDEQLFLPAVPEHQHFKCRQQRHEHRR